MWLWGWRPTLEQVSGRLVVGSLAAAWRAMTLRIHSWSAPRYTDGTLSVTGTPILNTLLRKQPNELHCRCVTSDSWRETAILSTVGQQQQSGVQSELDVRVSSGVGQIARLSRLFALRTCPKCRAQVWESSLFAYRDCSR